MDDFSTFEKLNKFTFPNLKENDIPNENGHDKFSSLHYSLDQDNNEDLSIEHELHSVRLSPKEVTHFDYKDNISILLSHKDNTNNEKSTTIAYDQFPNDVITSSFSNTSSPAQFKKIRIRTSDTQIVTENASSYSQELSSPISSCSTNNEAHRLKLKKSISDCVSFSKFPSRSDSNQSENNDIYSNYSQNRKLSLGSINKGLGHRRSLPISINQTNDNVLKFQLFNTDDNSVSSTKAIKDPLKHNELLNYDYKDNDHHRYQLSFDEDFDSSDNENSDSDNNK
jgi:hypothetical protein